MQSKMTFQMPCVFSVPKQNVHGEDRKSIKSPGFADYGVQTLKHFTEATRHQKLVFLQCAYLLRRSFIIATGPINVNVTVLGPA